MHHYLRAKHCSVLISNMKVAGPKLALSALPPGASISLGHKNSKKTEARFLVSNEIVNLGQSKDRQRLDSHTPLLCSICVSCAEIGQGGVVKEEKLLGFAA